MKLAFSIATCLVCVLPSQAETISSTYAPGDAFNWGMGYGVIGPSELAYPFNVPADGNYMFDSASLGLTAEQPIFPGTSTPVILASDSGGVPGAAMESFTVTGLLTGTAGSVKPSIVTSRTHPTLHGGNVYWLIVAPTADTCVIWGTAFILTTPDLRAAFSNGIWKASSLRAGDNWPGAFSVDATRVSSVPEPGSSVLLISGIILLTLARQALRASPDCFENDPAARPAR